MNYLDLRLDITLTRDGKQDLNCGKCFGYLMQSSGGIGQALV